MVEQEEIAEPVIRSMALQDAESVAELAKQLGYPRTVDAIEAWIRSSGEDGFQTAFVACFNGEVVGWIEASIQYRLQSDPFALIGGLVVREGIRGHGIGRRLCERAEEWASEHDIQMVRVTSRNSRADAHRFYLRGGYRETKTSIVFEKHITAHVR